VSKRSTSLTKDSSPSVSSRFSNSNLIWSEV
jgi:hypothetical protein